MKYWKENDIYYSETKQGAIGYVDLSTLPKKGSKIDWKNVDNYIPFKYHDVKDKLHVKYVPSENKTKVAVSYNTRTQVIQVGNLYRVKLNFITTGENKYIVHQVKEGDIIKNCEILKIIEDLSSTEFYVYNIKEEVYGKVYKQSFLKYKTDNYVPHGTIPQSKMLYHKKHIHRYVKNKTDLYNYKHTSRKMITTKCPNCSREKDIRIADLLKDNYSCQCSKQYSSFGERLTQSYLDIMGIDYIREYSFKDLGRKRFDFYLPDYNTVLEVHGIQHYKEVTGYMNHKKTKQSDTIKKKYCKENGIHYIEVDARKSTFKHILSNLDKVFKSYQVDRDKVIERYREIYR